MRDGHIPVGFDAAPEPADCFSVRTNLQLSKSDHKQPTEGVCIPWRETKGLVDMVLKLFPAT